MSINPVVVPLNLLLLLLYPASWLSPLARAGFLPFFSGTEITILGGVADLFPAELSGGMQKRVGLARAICAEPEIIFFDEPTTGLDPIMADVINDLIREIVVEMGVTAVTITHDMTSVRKIADRVAMIHDGVIQWNGPVAEIDTTDNPYVHQFVNGLAEGPIEAIR